MDANNSGFSLIKRATLPVQVAEAIQGEIDKGAFTPDELLPSERVLSELFGVSRVVVREAIQLLQAKGYVEVQQGKGSVVVDPAVRKAGTLADWMSGRKERLKMMIQLRSIVEPGIAELAAKEATQADAELLLKLAEELATCGQDDASATDAAFHLEIAKLTGNDLIVELLAATLEQAEVLREKTLKDDVGRRLASDGHTKIAQAIANGEAENARNAMLDHLIDASRSI